MAESFTYEDAATPAPNQTTKKPESFSYEEASGKTPDGPLARGWNKAKQSMSVTSQLATGNSAGAAQTIKQADDYARANPGMQEGKELGAAWERGDGISGGISEVAGEFAKDWREAPGVIKGLRATGRNLRALGEGVVEQVPNMVAPVTGMVGGALAGGAAGSAAPIVGNVAGAAVGGWVGASAGNTLVEGGGMTQAALQKAGISPQDTAAVEKYLTEHGDTILGQSATKGAIIGAVDTLTVGLGGRLLNAPARAAADRALAGMGVNMADKAAVKAATKSPEFAAKIAGDATYQASKQGAGNIARNVGAAALEPAGEFAGEFVGQGVATGEWDIKNAALEAFSSIGQSGTMFAGQKAYQALTRPAGAADAQDKADAIIPPWTTEPGAVDPNATQTPPAAPPEAPDLTTAPGAGVERDGMDFTREVDTSGLSLQDPAELERARAATVDYQPGDTTPQWDTQLGATGQRQGLDMPAPEFDTDGLGLDPIRQMVKQAADAGGALSTAAGVALDLGATNAQFLGATGRDVQLRRTGPGVTDESNVIDVDAREVPDQRGIPTARRLTNEQEGDARAAPSQTLALPAPTNLREGLERIRAQRQEAANAQAATSEAAPAAQPVPAARTGAVEAAGPAPVSPTTGVTSEPQTAQAQQSIAQPTQAGGAATAGPAAAPTAGQSAAPGGSGVQAAGVSNAATAENIGAQDTPAPGAQAAPGNANWAALTPEQRRRARLEHEIATGQTNNGGVVASLRPSAIEKRKQELAAMGDAGKLPSPGQAEPLSADGLAAQNPTVAPASQAQQAAPVAQQAAPNSGVAAPAQETTYNGTRIYPTKVKVGDEVKSMWAAESPDNQRRRAAGERTIGGDSLHDTLEQAQAAAEREAKRDAEQQAAKAGQDAADKARLDAEEARKAANRPKSVVERRKDAILDGPSKIGQGTKRAVITSAVDNGYAIEAKMVYDSAAKKRDQEAVDRASRAGYILGVSNENLPLVKAGNEAKARLKEGKYEKPEYRVYQGSDTKAPFREITKTEYDYAQELKAQREAAPQAAESPTLQTAMGDAGWAGETGQGDTIWTKRANGERYTALLSPDAGSMEVTVLVDAVDTQIASFKVSDPKAAADAANKAVASDVAESTAAAPASAEQRMPVQAIEPKKPATNKPRGVLAKKAEAEAKARADYFTPGNVVQGYSGHDRVIAYNPPGEDGQWSVTVRAVEKQGDTWVDKAGERERAHATPPDAKALKAGPVKQLWSRVPVPATDTGKSAPSAELGNEAGSKSTVDSSQSDAVSVPPTNPAAQPITRAEVTAAQQQAAAIITERIDAMTAGEVNTIARRFLPTMGVRPSVSKERNKAAVVDFTKVNPLAAADEFGATLPTDVRRALQADMEGRVTGQDGLMFSRGKNASVTTDRDVVGNQSGIPANDATTGAVDENTGLPLNADGSVTIYHHTSAAAAAAIRRTGTLKSQAEPDVYVTTHRETDTGYGDTAVAIRIDPARLQIDDEFPNGRKDFRLNVGRPGGSIRVELENEQSAPASQGGLAFSFAGQRAATADKHALATAQQRLEVGEDAETVRQETGWFQGKDGKWRFEINDADARLKDRAQWTAKIDGINAKLDAALQAKWQAEEQRNYFLRARGESPSRISSETKKTPEFKALAKALKSAEAATEKARHAAFLARQGDSLITVGDVLSHLALFAAYPGIADVRVDINDSLPAGNAAYTYELRAIELSGKSDAQQLLSTLLHEIQHGIQHIEGFAMGGNEDSRADVMQAVSQQRSLWADVYAVRRDLDAGKKLETVLAEWQDFLDAQPSAEALRIAQDPELETAVALQNMETLERQYAQLRNEGRGDTYRRLAGEVEARNTQARQGMNDAQRRATPPSQTADVADSRVIVMFNGKEMANAPMPTNAAPDAATTAQPLRTPASAIRAAITKAYGKLLGQLESKGLVTLTQTEDEAIEAAAQARADKTGQPLEEVRASLTGSVSNSKYAATSNVDAVAKTLSLNARSDGGISIVDARSLDIKRSSNGSIQGFFDPQTGQSFLIADNLTAEAAPGVLMHEVGIHMAADGSMKALFNRAAMMLKLQRGNPFMKAVQDRMDAAGETSGEEAAAYIAEAYENDRANAPASVQRWLADLLAAVKAWMFKKGIMGADRLTVADIAAVARANARSMARDGGATGGQGFGTAFSRAPAGDQTQTDSFKRWFAGSRVVDADGKPLRVFHGTGGDFSVFSRDRAGATTGAANAGMGFFFTDNAEVAGNYARMSREPQSIMPVYLSLQNPLRMEAKNMMEADRLLQSGLKENNDGAIITVAMRDGGTQTVYMARESSQVKSATGNRGTFGSKPSAFDGNVDSFSAEVLSDGLAADADFLRNFASTRTFKKFGLDGFDIPSNGLVFKRVSSVLQDFKIRDAVIKLIPVDVMNILISQKLSPDVLLNDVSVLSDLLSTDSDNPVTLVIGESTKVARAIAGVTAKYLASNSDLRVLPTDRNSAMGTQARQSDALVDGITGVRAKNPSALRNTRSKAADDGRAIGAVKGFHDGLQSGEYSIAYNADSRLSTIENFDPANPDIRFSRATSPTASTAASPAWDAPVQTGFDDVIYKLQDKNIDLKRVVESITKSVGHVADSINAYLKEELFHKRAAKRVEDFGARELKPLMNQMRLMGLGMEDVEEYLHARHAKEANAVIAQRNPGEPGLQDGGSGMTNQAADNYFAKLDPAQRRKLEAVAKNVDAIIDKTRKLYVSYGLENQDVVDGWASMYQHYIPLMREDKEGGMGTGQGFSVKGKETKGRTGSTRKVVDILANIASQREKLIVRGEKNQVTQALVGLARANPNSDFWEVRSQAPTERVFDERTGTVVERPIPNFKSRDNVVVAKVQDSNGNVTEQMVVFNEDNPRAVRMAAAMKNLDAGNLEGLLGMSAKITRYFSAINTQYNPVFGVVNLVRDVQGAMINLAATPLAGQQGKIAKDTVSALRGIYGDIRKTRRGGQATSQWSQLWEQMQDDGGTTGYRDLFTTSADRANNLKSILDPESWMDNKWGKFFTANGQLKVPMSIAQKGATEIFGWLSDYNEAMENGVRLAAYKAALDKGMSREQAASLAKNLTVNFNRKGQVGMQAGAVYAFFNAAMQGTARIGQTLFDMDGGDISTLRLSKTGKAVVYGGVTLGVMQALALAGAGFDEEDPPEFVRERSLIIPTGGKTYVSIPMPLGLHVIPGIGRHATEFALSGFDKPAKRALSVIGMFADAFNPIGNAGLSMQTLAPTALDPLVALTENKDWTGKPIARVSSNKALPGHTQWKDTATWYSKMAAEAINWVSGGNEYVAGALSPTPDQIDYLVAQVGGGVAREASKVFQAASTTVNGEELPTYKIPLLGRFAGNAASQASQGTAFYANLDRLNALETEIKGLRKDGRFGEAAQLARENPQAAMIPMANRAERDVQKLRRDKRELIATGATREEVRAKEAQITAVMARLNEAAARRKATAPE